MSIEKKLEIIRKVKELVCELDENQPPKLLAFEISNIIINEYSVSRFMYGPIFGFNLRINGKLEKIEFNIEDLRDELDMK